jgi:integrase
MPVDDLWYLTKRGPNKKKLPSKRHGQGKRWRVRFEDSQGVPRTKFFERLADAQDFDAGQRSGLIVPSVSNRADRFVTFFDYGERWRMSRRVSQALDYQRHLDSRLRHHIYPYFGGRAIRAISVTDVLEWIAALIAKQVAQLSLRTYFDVLNNILNAAVVDKAIEENPCRAVRITTILRGLSQAPKWVPTTDQVLSLVDVVPSKYLAAIWLGAGEGMRLGEVLGIENGKRCIDPDSGHVHVVQQLRFHKAEYGGFYLAPPKSGSIGDVDLDDTVATVLADHEIEYPPVAVELADITRGTPDPGKPATRRLVELLFTDDLDHPIHDQAWSKLWKVWRSDAGWPDEGTFHSLRHYYATALIVAGADPTDVQKALRHSKLRTTLETYVHWWPKKDRRRNVVGTALKAATAARRGTGSG